METTNTEKLAVSIYTEMTPNPETLKFVANKLIYPGKSIEFLTEEDAVSSALARALFGFDYVKGIFIASNFVTLTKTPNTDWNDVIPEMRDFLKNYLIEDKEIVNEALVPEKNDNDNNKINEDDSDVVKRIKELLENYVKPAVEMDGGAISFKRFEEGKVTLLLQGSCSGCPSSTVTLKAGIEGMMKRMIPEVSEVVAEAD
jgi:Fe-S cluster biogenesis protein NfuA